MKIHSGEKNFKCIQCKYSTFEYLGNLIFLDPTVLNLNSSDLVGAVRLEGEPGYRSQCNGIIVYS